MATSSMGEGNGFTQAARPENDGACSVHTLAQRAERKAPGRVGHPVTFSDHENLFLRARLREWHRMSGNSQADTAALLGVGQQVVSLLLRDLQGFGRLTAERFARIVGAADVNELLRVGVETEVTMRAYPGLRTPEPAHAKPIGRWRSFSRRPS